MRLPSTPKSDSAKELLSKQSVAELARSYGRQVFEAAFRVLNDHAQAEDVQQEVFLRLIQKPVGKVESWPALLTTMAVHLALDQVRRRNRWLKVSSIWRSSDESGSISAEENVSQIERATRLRNEITRLRPKDAECFTLRCVHGLEIAEIAAATNMSANHVSVCIHRATQRLELRLGCAPSSTTEGIS